MLVESIARSTARRRQVSTSTVLGPYVVDFLCLEPKDVIEVDGGQHVEQVSNDLRRTEYLKVLGYHVWLRSPHPRPLPAGEGVNGIPIDSAEEPKKASTGFFS